MLKVLVDSGSSIKQEEAKDYNVEVIPLILSFDDKEYLDGVDITIEEFYDKLIKEKKFPKTSLPNLLELQEKVEKYTKDGDDVLIITISSKISGTYNAIRGLFAENNKVKVIDSQSAVGGIRILVEEVNRNREKSLDEIETILNDIIPRIKVCAIPETLEYLMRGGRLSKKEWLFGSILNIKPIITFKDGEVKVMSKKMGLKNAMNGINQELETVECDERHGIVAAYTFCKNNLLKLIDLTKDKFKKLIKVFDNLDPAIACHWGPNAFGYIFVSKKKKKQMENITQLKTDK
ncbi:MAG: DegV family protein [Clostridia bacterium]|nr:DegV family protein [Clostridia bacterium]